MEKKEFIHLGVTKIKSMKVYKILTYSMTVKKPSPVSAIYEVPAKNYDEAVSKLQDSIAEDYKIKKHWKI